MENKSLIINMVQGQIGYVFKNPNLLLQAFTRRSYANEHGGENNEILEFIGDKSLDLAVINFLVLKYGKTKNKFCCSLDEGKLTELKSKMVRKSSLAQRTDELGFAKFLVVGKGDVKDGLSVKEDLFEAILGAVTLDCNWDFSTICSVVDAMLAPDNLFLNFREDNYVRMIYDWEKNVNGVIPLFWFKKFSHSLYWYKNFNGITQTLPFHDCSKLKYSCELKLLNDLPIYRGFGTSKSEAQMNVCKLAYKDLKVKGVIKMSILSKEIKNPTEAKAISQLEILAQRKYFSTPTYKFNEKHTDGICVWNAECHIKEYDTYFNAVSHSKKLAKKSAAFKMLQFILDNAY